MELDEQQAVEAINYQGQSYYFCSSSCKHLFEQNPHHYTDQQSAHA
ncbi:MAG: YHS domain-containing protein [Acidobacteriota bacterium]